MLSLLNDESTYRILNRDSTKCIERRLNSFIYNLFKSQRISQMQYYQLRSTDATAPRLYGLPKIHKKDIPMRPIVSFINSPLYNLSKFLCKLLSPLVGNTEFTVKNSYEFVQFLNSIVLKKNECMVSFDVVSLFTNIPVELAKKVTFDLLNEDDTLCNRTDLTMDDIEIALNFCLSNTYFTFEGKYYQQIFGVPMGSPISVVIANLVMEYVEQKAISSFSSSPKLWKRFVDDTFVIMHTNEVNRFFDHLNSVDPNINFTMELEQDDNLAFLDVLVMRTQDGKLATKVHRKPTHTNRYLNYHSAHSNEQKQGVVINLYNRAQSLTTKSTDWKKEKSFLSHMLAENDYPNWFIQTALKKRKTQAQVKLQEEEKHIGLVILPFIPGITERLKRLLKNHQIKVATKPLRTVGNMLPSLKDKINKFDQRGVVYKIPCLDCTGVYIGETGRSFKTRRKEHQRDVKPDIIAKLTNEELKKKSALVKHVCLNGHRIDWESSKILATESDYKKRRFLESFYIHKTDFSFNDKINSFYPGLYKSINF